MRTLLAALVACLVLMVPSWGLGQPAPQPAPQAATVAPQPAPGEGLPDDGGGEPFDIVDVTRGQAAPFSGVLLSEGRYVAVAAMRGELEETRGTLAVKSRLVQALTEQLAAAREERDPGWLERHTFEIGFVVGAAAAGLAVYGAVEILRVR